MLAHPVAQLTHVVSLYFESFSKRIISRATAANFITELSTNLRGPTKTLLIKVTASAQYSIENYDEHSFLHTLKFFSFHMTLKLLAWRFMEALGGSWRLLEALGGSWRLLEALGGS